MRLVYLEWRNKDWKVGIDEEEEEIVVTGQKGEERRD